MKAKKPFKKRFIRLLIIFGILFFVMLGLRLLYGYKYSELRVQQSGDQEVFSSFGDVKKNYASEKMELKEMSVKMPSPSQSEGSIEMPNEAKYEKTATLRSKTSQFEKDETNTRSQISRFKAVIQYEKKTGNKGNRELRLLIGVTPERFDFLYTALQKIGQIKSNEVVKVDKTNDYRKLMAEKASYERILNSLNELKSKNGNIQEYISLHDKIFEIESQMQDIGVRLGDFNTEDQFCTIKLSLLEGIKEKTTNSFWIRLKVAFEWTAIYYLLLLLAFAAISLTAFLIIVSSDKIVDMREKMMARRKQK